jgi:hypothetical protein
MVTPVEVPIRVVDFWHILCWCRVFDDNWLLMDYCKLSAGSIF